jgi:hypothetical protein
LPYTHAHDTESCSILRELSGGRELNVKFARRHHGRI